MDPDPPDALPWWAQARARLCLLLLILFATGGAAVLASVTLGSAGADDGCWIAEGPPPIWLRTTVVTAAGRRLGLAWLPAPGAAATRGLSTPQAAWSGGPPQPGRPAADLVPAGYAVTWRSSRGETLGAAAYRFANEADAAAFVTHAASPRCRPGSAAGAVSSPPGARQLTLRGSTPEISLFFHRGSTGYWLSETAPGTHPPNPAGLRRLACRLTQARCI